MAKLRPDSITKYCTKPLVLVPDSQIQRNPVFSGKQYLPPCKYTESSFRIISVGVHQLSPAANFIFLNKPAYLVFNDDLYKDHRNTFWKPLLKTQFPVYYISPFFGVGWLGDNIGFYDITMEETFYIWRQLHLWQVIMDLYDTLQCDAVLSYLPQIYDNTVFVEGLPWYKFGENALKTKKHRETLLSLAKNLHGNAL